MRSIPLARFAERVAEPFPSSILLVAIFLAFIFSPIYAHSDPLWTLHFSLSLARGYCGDLLPVDTAALIASHPGHAYAVTHMPDGRVLSILPAGTSILLSPIVWLFDQIAHEWVNSLAATTARIPHKVFAAAISAISVILLYRALLFRFSATVALAVVPVFAFATSMWSTASRALWSHDALILFICLGLYLTLRPASTRMALLAGASFAAAFAMRPTGAIALAAMGIVFAARGPKAVMAYGLGTLVIGLLLIAFNMQVWGEVIPPYYNPSRIAVSSTVWQALAGNLFSPARGLFVFSPVLLLALPGFYLAFRTRDDRPLGFALLAAVVVHWIVVSRFPHWWGGHSFGPRFMSDILPFLMVALAFTLQRAEALEAPRFGIVLATFVTLSMISVAIHSQGAIKGAGSRWNYIPNNIDRHPERLWDWHDPQFLAGFRDWRGLAK